MHHGHDLSKDFVQQHREVLRRQARQRFDRSDRPWERQNDPLLRRQFIPLRLYLIFVGTVVVLVIALVFLLSFYSPAGGPG